MLSHSVGRLNLLFRVYFVFKLLMLRCHFLSPPQPEEITFSPDMRAARAFDKSHSDNVSVKLFGLA